MIVEWNVECGLVYVLTMAASGCRVEWCLCLAASRVECGSLCFDNGASGCRVECGLVYVLTMAVVEWNVV